MQDQFFYLFSAVLLGVVIGAVLMYMFSNSAKNKGRSAEELEQELSSYKDEVAEHFEKTTDLVEELTQNYKKVFDHLGKSARHLMSDEQLQLQIDKRKGNKVTLEFLNEDKERETELEPEVNSETQSKAESETDSEKQNLSEESQLEIDNSADNSTDNPAENSFENAAEDIAETTTEIEAKLTEAVDTANDVIDKHADGSK